MKKFDVKDKVVLVTGASTGIGRATAAAFAALGAKVALVARDEQKLKQAADDIKKSGGTAEVFPLDLSRIDQIPAVVRSVKDKLGTVDILVNNAAYSVAGLVEDCPVDQYKKNFDVNFFAPLALIQAVLPGMKQKKSGQIINVSSGVGRRALPGFSSYCVTKFALNGLTESLRVEVKPFGIDVILISPGAVSSNFHSRVEFYGRWKMELPAMQMRSPGQIAELIVKASGKRSREATVFGPGMIGHHLNYWSPGLVDGLLAKRYPVS